MLTLDKLKKLAIASGIVGFLLFILTPFLPVNQTQSTIHWPQGDNQSITAPLMSYAPEKLEATIPVAAFDELHDGQNLLLGTLPQDSKDATQRGLFIRLGDNGLDAVVKDKVIFSITQEDVDKLAPTDELKLTSDADKTTVTLGTHEGEATGDERPQVTGLYTELNRDAEIPGLSADITVNSRFTSSPSLIKYLAMWSGIACLLVSLFSLWKFDQLAGDHTSEYTPRWKSITLLDGVVAAILLFWYFIGANTSDDGFILTMARQSHAADYMANYYRWYGVPESPFGAPYYDLLGLMTYVSTSSIWVRLPQLVAAVLTWLLLSREVLPRLGQKITERRVAHWTAAFVFLAFWLPYNNGIRPEPIIAALALLTWVLVEKCFATNRLLYGAIAVIVATIALGAGPTGLMAVGALLAGIPAFIRMLHRRRSLGIVAQLVPFLPTGFAILMAVFGDQTLRTVTEAVHVRSAKGPSLPWYLEWVRYETLMGNNVDGSFTRRFAVILMFAAVVLVIASTLRHGGVIGAAKAPTFRLVMMFALTMFAFCFTPTKWSHHFGVFAGLGAALAALAAIVVSQIALRSVRNRLLIIGAFLFLLAFCLAGQNAWWYISSFGVPWFDKSIQFRGVEASTVMLVISLLVLLVGVVFGFLDEVREVRGDRERTGRRLAKFDGLFAAPIAVLAALVVLFSCFSLGKAFVSQYPAYSVGLGNLRALTGKTCNLAEDALLETNTNDAFLTPLEGTLADSLDDGNSQGFGPNNIPETIVGGGVDTSGRSAGTVAGASDADEDTASGDSAGSSTSTQGARAEQGANGSNIRLPFGIDYTKVPVMGSQRNGAQFGSKIETKWYALPQTENPLLVISAAGKVAHHDINGVKQPGQKLVVEYGKRDGQGVEKLGEVEPMDIGPAPQWRNLRVPLDQLPEEADAVRITAEDTNLNGDEWVAFTPPRVPQLAPLNEVIGSEKPGLLDWAVSLQFPCQRSFDHYAGVAEVPEYRISPDHPGKVTLSPFQDYNGGGVMGIAEAVNKGREIPGYLKDDWQRDWGSIEEYSLRTNSLGEEPKQAAVDTEVITRSGLWYPGPMATD